MIYPVLFAIPGFFLVGFSSLHHAHPWVLVATAVAAMAGFVIQSPVLLGLALVGGLGAGYAVGEADLGSIAATGFLGWACLSVAMVSRCPRCEYTLVPQRGLFSNLRPADHWCIMCGRDRRGVWPLQYMSRPEAWDGEYHDEGGGAPDFRPYLEWSRGVRFRRVNRKRRHTGP